MLLQPQQNLAVFPQVFDLVEIALVGREEMHDHVPEIHHHPAVAGKSLLFALLLIFLADVVHGGAGERVQHAVAGAGADDEIVGERNDVFQVQQDDVFPFFIFKGVYDFTSEFKCVQMSPHGF